MEAILIDAFEFCRHGEVRAGEFAVADFPRLTAELAVSTGVIRWTLTGGKHALGYPQLTVTVAGSVQLMCQRCLTPYELVIDVESVLVLAQDEVGADELEASLDDESLEVIAGSRQFSVTDLVEDEALLALPVSPRHDVCPEPSPQDASADNDKAPTRFGSLKDWKR